MITQREPPKHERRAPDRRRRRRATALPGSAAPTLLALLAAGAALCAIGCASASHGASAGPAVASVDGVVIGERAVRHWALVLEHGGVEGALARAGGSPARRAEEYLIGSRWLLAEASVRGVSPTRGAVRERVSQRREAVPGGAAAFAESLAASGMTLADVERVAEVELATQALRRIVLRRARPVAPARVRAVYEREIARYRTPEARQIDIVEHLPSRSAARSLARRLGSGGAFARRAAHERQVRPAAFDERSAKGRVVRAIFAARPGVLVGPMPLAGAWTLFVVRRVARASTVPFAAVAASLRARLERGAQAAALERFAAAMRARWQPRTSCRAGFVVARCAGALDGGAGEAGLLGGV